MRLLRSPALYIFYIKAATALREFVIQSTVAQSRNRNRTETETEPNLRPDLAPTRRVVLFVESRVHGFEWLFAPFILAFLCGSALQRLS